MCMFPCVCVCVCRRMPWVIASCRSAGHVPPMWNCQRLLWQRDGKQKLSAPGVRERQRRWNEAQTFFLGYYPQLAVPLTPRLSRSLWSPPVSFVFSVLQLSFSSLFLSLSAPPSACLSALWDRGVRNSWVHSGEREREGVREGKSVRAWRCERGRWEKGGGKESVRRKLKKKGLRTNRDGQRWERE